MSDATKVGFQLYSLKDFAGGWDAAFAAVKSMGIDAIEPWCGAVPSDPAQGMSVQKLRASLDAAGMELVCGHVTAAEYDARYEVWKDLLLDYGSRHWVIPFAKAETLEQWLALLPKYGEMAQRLAADGLKLGYHNHHMELETFGGKRVFEHLLDGMPALQAQFHINQFKPERGVDLTAWIRRYAGRVCSLHVNDAAADGPCRLGQGNCGAEAAVRTALDAGVDTFIVEIPLKEETLDGVRQDVETLLDWVG